MEKPNEVKVAVRVSILLVEVMSPNACQPTHADISVCRSVAARTFHPWGGGGWGQINWLGKKGELPFPGVFEYELGCQLQQGPIPLQLKNWQRHGISCLPEVVIELKQWHPVYCNV